MASWGHVSISPELAAQAMFSLQPPREGLIHENEWDTLMSRILKKNIDTAVINLDNLLLDLSLLTIKF